MNLSPLSLVIPTLIAVASWFVGHHFAAKRDRANKRRELRLQMLIEAYRLLAGSSNRTLTDQRGLDIEKGIEAIQLVGTPEQVRLTQELAKEFVEKRGVDWHPLLVQLRRSIRAELQLEPTGDAIVHFRHAQSTDSNVRK